MEEQSLTGLALVERREEVVAATFARVTAIVDSSDAATLPPSLRVHHVNGSMFGFLADDGQKIFWIIVTSKTDLRRTGFDILLCCLSPTLTRTALSLSLSCPSSSSNSIQSSGSSRSILDRRVSSLFNFPFYLTRKRIEGAVDEDSRKIDETQDQLEIPSVDRRRDISPRAVVQLFGLNPVSRMSRISVLSDEEITSMTR